MYHNREILEQKGAAPSPSGLNVDEPHSIVDKKNSFMTYHKVCFFGLAGYEFILFSLKTVIVRICTT